MSLNSAAKRRISDRSGVSVASIEALLSGCPIKPVARAAVIEAACALGSYIPGVEATRNTPRRRAA